MNNNAKLSKVMLLAGALIFASFCSVSVRAQNVESDSVNLDSVVVTGVGAYESIRETTVASGKLQEEQYKNKKAYEEAQKNYYAQVAEQQKAVQEAKTRCDKNPNDCAAYDAARKQLQALQSDDNEAKKAVEYAREKVQETSDAIKKQTREAENAVYKARKEENKNLKDAEKDIKKYCGDGKKADAAKCAEARENKQKAELALQQIDVSEQAATGQSRLTQQAIEERDAQVKANEQQIADLNRKLSQLDPSDPSYSRKKSELEAQKKQLETYNKGVEQAKIKEGLIAPGTKSSAELAKDMAQSQNEYAAAKDAYTQAAEDLAKTNAACAKGDTTACGQKKDKERALESARQNADAAYQKKVGAEKAASGVNETSKAEAEIVVAAQNKAKEAAENLSAAKAAEAEACKGSDTQKCEDAKKATAQAEQANQAAKDALADPVGAAQKKLEDAKRAEEAACQNPDSNECGAAQKATAEAMQEMALLLKAQSADAQSNVKQAKALTEAKAAELDSLKAQLNEAQQACEYSSKLTSKAGKADAEKYCAQAAQLEQQVSAAEADLVAAEKAQAVAEAAANALGGENLDHTGQVYQAFSTAQNKDGSMFEGEYVGSGNFANEQDIFKTMTKRAMRILVGLKPIVYTFAGFGLIGFAWMAIFNKISWKWFSNIAISLFLVANMGRFIEYFVYPDINGEVQAQKLAFGDYLSKGYADTDYVWVDEISAYMPPKAIGEEEIPDVGINVPEAETNVRGFCQAEKKGGGLFGGGGFMSCVKDLVAAGKKAVDTVKKVQNTVDIVKSTVDQVKSAAQNIGDAAKMIGKGNLEDTFTALGKIGQNVNAIVGASGGMVNGIMSNVSDITNNVQDMTKSRDQVAELNEKRARGEATNKIDAALKGQKIDADGNVERLWGGLDKDGNQKEGKIAGNSNFLTGVQDVTNDVVQKSRELNGQYQDAMSTVGNLAAGVGNFSAFGSKTINQTLQDKQAAKRERENQAARAEAEAQNAARKTAQQELAAGREAASQANTNVSNQQNYTAAVQNAQSAEQTAKNRESTAVNAQKDAAAKQQTADKLNQAAQAAKEQAEKSGTVEDKRAAVLAAQRANIAQAQADAAKTKADSSKAAAEEARKQADAAKQQADSLRGGAVSEGIDKARETQENAAQTIEQAEKAIAENKANLSAQQDAVSKADAALQEAIKKAQESGSDADYREVGHLQSQKKEAETALKQTQQNIAVQEAARAAAERAAAEAKVKQAQLEAEKDSGLTQDKISQMENEDEQAERLRQEYARNNTASAQAKAAKTKAGQAQTAAESAKITAEAKELAAQRAAQAAAAARAKAAETGTLEDQRAAELASRRAELAENEAQAAKEAVKEREAEAEELTKESVSASLNETQYLQSYYER